TFRNLEIANMASVQLEKIVSRQNIDLLSRQRGSIAKLVGWVDFQAGNEKEATTKRELISDLPHGD
ncbi:hypothetical protein BGZ99_009200, partial [Dissophora globulifera]